MGKLGYILLGSIRASTGRRGDTISTGAFCTVASQSTLTVLKFKVLIVHICSEYFAILDDIINRPRFNGCSISTGARRWFHSRSTRVPDQHLLVVNMISWWCLSIMIFMISEDQSSYKSPLMSSLRKAPLCAELVATRRENKKT